MDEQRVKKVYNAIRSDGKQCQIMEYENDFGWRVHPGLGDCPFLKTLPDGTFMDESTGLTFKLTDQR